MKIVIAGIGKIGYILTSRLCKEGHDVIIVDKNAEILADAQNKLDVSTVVGNGASVEVQIEAGVPTADLLIAVTPSDEVNLLCSMVAKKLGCRGTIARVRNPEYDRQMQILGSDFGLTFSFNPEKTAANEIFHLLQFPYFMKRDSFAGGRADMVEIKVSKKSSLAGKKLCQLSDVLTRFNAIVCAAERDDEIIIPSGEFELLAEDKITVAAPPKKLPKIAQAFGMQMRKIKNVMIIGGSHIAVYLAQLLTEEKINVKLIETSREKCRYLAEILPDVSVICGNGTDQQLLIDEGIKTADAIVSLTGVDEENFMISMFANYVGVPKTITKNNHIEYSEIFKGTGIDSVISPKYLAASLIIRYVRAASASASNGSMEALYRILDDKAEAMGFSVPETGDFIGVPLEVLHFRKNTLIALILRGQKIIIPRGSDSMLPGDSIIVVSKAEYAISGIPDLFVKGDNGGR